MPSKTVRETVAESLVRVEWQRVAFAAVPRRLDLLELSQALFPQRSLLVNVHRNQPFEFIASCANSFIRFAGWKAEFTYSDYDDTLSFQNYKPADIEFIWLDFSRYTSSPEGLISWLEERLRHLRELTVAPILIANQPGAGPGGTAEFNESLKRLIGALPGARMCDQAPVLEQLESSYYDPRSKAMTAMELSATACVETARRLAFFWLVPALAPRIKAVVLDLDNTLYSGVLGEDGPAGVLLTPEHDRLQQYIVALQQSGVFVAIVSKNEIADVEQLFRQRDDFKLSSGLVSAWSVSWGLKSDGLRAVAEQLRIGLDAMLFVDDNPGELAEVASRYPELRLLHASDPAHTLRALLMYPGLQGYPIDRTDGVRVGDLAAVALRTQQQNAATDPFEYLASLQIHVTLALNPHDEVRRLHELSIKTNQFNTGLLRLTEADVAHRLNSPSYAVISIWLRDRLSDSGSIGAVFARLEENSVFVEEIAISCRALGRQIEDAFLTEAFHEIARAYAKPISTIVFRCASGPRNAPAREWLKRYTGTDPSDSEEISMPFSHVHAVSQTPVTVQWRSAQ